MTEIEIKDDIKIKAKITDYDVASKFLKLKHSADDRKIEFSLSLAKVRQLLTVKKCFYTGKIFEEEGSFARSIDRVDSSKGYSDDNVVACTIHINGLKKNLEINEIFMLNDKIKLHQKTIKKSKK